MPIEDLLQGKQRCDEESTRRLLDQHLQPCNMDIQFILDPLRG